LRQAYILGVDAAELRRSDVPSYIDFAFWQKSKEFAAGIDFWRRELDGLSSVTRLSHDKNSPNALMHPIAYEDLEISGTVSMRVVTTAKSCETTNFVVLLTALFVALSRNIGMSKLCIGTTVAGRHRVDLEDTVGCFVNIVPVIVDLVGELSIQEAIRKTAYAVSGALEHQDVPFELFRKHSGMEGIRENFIPITARFQAVAISKQLNWSTNLTMQESRAYAPSYPASPVEVDFQFFGDTDGFRARISYAQDLFERGTISAFLTDYMELLRILTEDKITESDK
jgi:non-ribosomal peptide synthetase component F